MFLLCMDIVAHTKNVIIFVFVYSFYRNIGHSLEIYAEYLTIKILFVCSDYIDITMSNNEL